MVVRVDELRLAACRVGLRMQADEFLALPESPVRYELVHGVVVMSPAASFGHQDVAGEILFQLRSFLEAQPIGRAVADVDVKLASGVVYRPDVLFLTSAKAARVGVSVQEPPDLVVEIVSADSRQHDAITKRADYEAAGVSEYWLIDPALGGMCFFVLDAGKYRQVEPAGERYAASVLPGFELRLERIRRLF